MVVERLDGIKDVKHLRSVSWHWHAVVHDRFESWVRRQEVARGTLCANNVPLPLLECGSLRCGLARVAMVTGKQYYRTMYGGVCWSASR